MTRDDWYRGDDWSPETRKRFEAKLARAHRGGRGQYLRLKGEALLGSTDDGTRRAGATLLRRVLDEYADDLISVVPAHIALARYAEEEGDPEQAIAHLREMMRRQEGTGVHLDAWMLLVKLVLRQERADAYDEAEALLDRAYDRQPLFRSEQFDYAVARMRLADRRGHADEAAAFAMGALALFGDNRPAAPRHPDIGLIRADDATLDELEAVADRGDPEAVGEVIERYRSPDGRVRWTFDLVLRLRGVPPGSLLERQEQAVLAGQTVVEDLRAAGFEVYDLYDFGRRRLPDMAAVRRAAPVLLHHLATAKHPAVLASIADALDDRRYRKLATQAVVDAYRRVLPPTPPITDGNRDVAFLKENLARALSTLARDEYFDDLAEFLRDPRHGHSRAYLMGAIPYLQSDDAVGLAIELLEDRELGSWALGALADLRTERAAPLLQEIASRPRPRGRSRADESERDRIDVARRGLEKLEKARAKGRSRP